VGGNEHRAHLDAPAQAHLLEDEDGHEPADDQPARPPGVQDVHAGGLFVGVEGGRERVDHRLDQAVTEPGD
jgi:hypothetical protein